MTIVRAIITVWNTRYSAKTFSGCCRWFYGTVTIERYDDSVRVAKQSPVTDTAKGLNQLLLHKSLRIFLDHFSDPSEFFNHFLSCSGSLGRVGKVIMELIS